jgi:molecular chaperone IbpA
MKPRRIAIGTNEAKQAKEATRPLQIESEKQVA